MSERKHCHDPSCPSCNPPEQLSAIDAHAQRADEDRKGVARPTPLLPLAKRVQRDTSLTSGPRR